MRRDCRTECPALKSGQCMELSCSSVLKSAAATSRKYFCMSSASSNEAGASEQSAKCGSLAPMQPPPRFGWCAAVLSNWDIRIIRAKARKSETRAQAVPKQRTPVPGLPDAMVEPLRSQPPSWCAVGFRQAGRGVPPALLRVSLVLSRFEASFLAQCSDE